MTQEITYYCAFCDKRETVVAPTSFVTRYAGDQEDAFCPDHAGAREFLDDQCPGCVNGWGECGLFIAVGNNAVSDSDKAEIIAGRCPYRINGTLSFSRSEGVRQIDLSTKSEAGEAFVAALTS